MDIQTITMWPDGPAYTEILQTLCESTNFDDFMKQRLTKFLKSLVEELSKKKKIEKSDNDKKNEKNDIDKKKRKVTFVLPEAKKLRRANPALRDLDGEKSSDSGSNSMPDDPTGGVSSNSVLPDTGSVSSDSVLPDSVLPDTGGVSSDSVLPDTGSVSSTPIFAVSESSFRLKIHKQKTRKRHNLYALIWKRALNKVSCSNKITENYFRAVAEYLVESSLMKNKKPMSDFEQIALQYLRNQPTLLESLERVIKNNMWNIARHQIIIHKRMLIVLNEISRKQ